MSWLPALIAFLLLLIALSGMAYILWIGSQRKGETK